ncbi:MAG: alpha/beta fold hydrolase [Vicinamibacterales bacterium]
MTTNPTITRVESADGTGIVVERRGSGPAVILVDGALCSRAFGPSCNLAQALAPEFTVYSYDRRGRGDSGDRSPYAPAREVDDLAAVLTHAGGSAALIGQSSGAALALEAAASGLPLSAVVAYEPPYVDHAGTGPELPHLAALHERLQHGDRGGAVAYFMRDMVHVPVFIVIMMRVMPWFWRKMKAVAHTLPYDTRIMTGFRVPRARLGSIRVPVLVMHGSNTDQRLKGAAQAVATAIPGARHRELPRQTHNVSAAVLAAAATEFIRSAIINQQSAILNSRDSHAFPHRP